MCLICFYKFQNGIIYFDFFLVFDQHPIPFAIVVASQKYHSMLLIHVLICRGIHFEQQLERENLENGN